MVTEEEILGAVKDLLHKYAILFQKPKQLPPHRRHDHRIPLKDGVNAMAIRPYKHSVL